MTFILGFTLVAVVQEEFSLSKSGIICLPVPGVKGLCPLSRLYFGAEFGR